MSLPSSSPSIRRRKRKRKIEPVHLKIIADLEVPDCRCYSRTRPELICHRLGICHCLEPDQIEQMRAEAKREGRRLTKNFWKCEHCLRKCDCVVAPPPPCEHVLAAVHDMPIDLWAEYLWSIDRKYRPALLRIYEEPPPPPRPPTVLDRDSRVDLMEERAALDSRGRRTPRSVGLYHPGDLKAEEVDEAGRKIQKHMNGEMDRNEPLVLDHADNAARNALRLYRPPEKNDERPGPKPKRAARTKRGA